MSVMQSFQINFDNPQCTYFGGEMVTGRLHIRLDRSTRTRGIELKFRGEARVYWEKKIKEKDEEGNSLMSIEEHTSHELYFDTPFYVLGGPYILLQPGEHIYNFNMQLPSVLPSSFEGKLGYIRYTLLATLIQDMHANMVAKSAFTVLCPLDLNREQNVKNPVMISDDKFLCCCCCKSGPITCALSLPATGFAPGQEIPFSLEVENYSNSTVRSIHFSLIKNVSFTVTRPKKETETESTKVVQMVLNGVASNDKYSWTERLEVPSLPPSYLKHCTIIDIAYSLEVEVKISGLHKNMFIRVPIVIGTVPLATQASNSSGGRPEQFIPATVPTAPPAYEDCMLGAVNIQERGDVENLQGNLKFAPRYPVYRTQTPC
ncbi:Arrestin domain-containing protein 2 [Gryllus bimaculatus]|nr:Arrestin domain-containing protein 2 [Gryllus bimaculatus]